MLAVALAIPLLLSLPNLAVDWWHWVMPLIPSPDKDKTGAITMNTQPKNSPVYFLGSEYNGADENRHIVITQKPIFFPILNSVFISYSAITEDQLNIDEQNFLTSIEKPDKWVHIALLDGKPIEAVHIRTPVFGVTVPNNSPFTELRPGDGLAISDGWWVYLPPLSVGNHVLVSAGGAPNFSAGFTYYIRVV